MLFSDIIAIYFELHNNTQIYSLYKMRGVLWLQHGNKHMSLHFWGVQMQNLPNGAHMKNTSFQFDDNGDGTREIRTV
jgi:hypothetical protein